MTERRAREAGPTKDPITGKWGFVFEVPGGEAGKRKQIRRRGFRTRNEAKDELERIGSEVKKQTYVAPVRQTVNEWLDEWLTTMSGHLEPSTLSSYRRVLRIHVRPRLGGIQLQQLNAGAINKMYAELRETLAPRTVRYVHAIVRGALREAVRAGRVARNVADAASPPRARESQAREMTAWSAGEVSRFFALDEVKQHRHRVAWWVAFTTGMRRGELLGLRWSDVDLDACRVSIVQTCIAVDHEVVLRLGTKTGKGRTFEIDAATVAELRAHRARQAQDQLALGIRIRPGDASLLFARPDGTPLDPDRFSEMFIRLVERHPELPRIRFHDIRHTHASVLLRAGVPITVVSRRLGHSSITITGDVYSHVTSEMQADAAERGAALMLGAAL